eukprot:1158494-Pelagomonas_calceolata.AAC.1
MPAPLSSHMLSKLSNPCFACSHPPNESLVSFAWMLGIEGFARKPQVTNISYPQHRCHCKGCERVGAGQAEADRRE